MTITRRTFIKGAAVLPLVTLPGLSFAKGPQMPTADDVLTFGNLWDLKRPLTDDEIKNLYAEVASLLYIELDHDAAELGDITDIWQGRVNNFIEFQVAYTDPKYMAFGMVAMLQHYGLPLVPYRLASFDDFYAKAGDYIRSQVDNENGRKEWDLMSDDISRIIATNPNCVDHPTKYTKYICT